MNAVEPFVILRILLPIYLILTPAGFAVMGWQIALRMTILLMLTSLAMFDVIFYSWQQMPFTCAYEPGEKQLVSTLAGWLGVMGVLVPVLAIFVATMSQMTELFLIYAPIVAGTRYWLRKRRREGWGDSRLIYEEPRMSSLRAR